MSVRRKRPAGHHVGRHAHPHKGGHHPAKRHRASAVRTRGAARQRFTSVSRNSRVNLT